MDTPSKGVFAEKYLTPLAIIVGAIIIAAVFAFGHGTTATPAAGTAGSAGVPSDISKVKTDGEPFVGNANAPVTMALYFDYQCPFCKQFEQQVTPALFDAYVKTGKVKIVLKDFQFLGEDSTTDALFARAMWEAYPDHFYDWFKAMMDAQDEEGDKGFGDLDSVKTLTAKIDGVDVNKVVKLMTDKKDAYQAAIDADRKEGAALGINGTPSIIVGKKLFTAISPQDFTTGITNEINAQLK
jgi:protein-disulfide isomerase